LIALAVNPPAEQPSAKAAVQAAQTFLEKFVALGLAFDPAMADLYSDGAVIKSKRIYPNGHVRDLSMPAPLYKELIRKTMPLAKLRGDISRLLDCSYTPEGERVRI